jgi:Fic/DOC family
MEIAPTWICPDVHSPEPAEQRLADRLISQLANSELPADPVSTAGLELRVALTLLQDDRGHTKPDNQFWRSKCRSLFLRPAIEPIAHAHWARFHDFRVDESCAVRIASALAGRPLVYRKGPAVGRSVKGDVHFAPLETAGGWLNKLKDAGRCPSLRAVLPAYFFAQTIMTHPFSDGNGRFARLMIHAGLEQSAGVTGPLIALAPAFYRRADALSSALNNLHFHADWTGFYRVFFSTLDDALQLSRALVAQSA